MSIAREERGLCWVSNIQNAVRDALDIYVYVFGDMCLIILGGIIFWKLRSLVEASETKKVGTGHSMKSSKGWLELILKFTR